ncbi:MAG: hypothetical protein V7776_18375 [Halopseudomonas aestusnigri]
MTFFRVSIMTSMERNAAISKVSDAISNSGGWIVNHTLLSNVAATLNFELPSEETEGLLLHLEELSFHPDVDGDVPQGKEGDLRGQITLTFIHNNPDLKRDVPAFG